MKQFLKTKKEITAWLDKYQIKNYTLIRDTLFGYKVNVKGNVNLVYLPQGERRLFLRPHTKKSFASRHKMQFRHIPIKFNIVTGSFDASCNNLQKMKWAPKIVGQDYIVTHNKIKTLANMPKKIGRNIWFRSNCLTSLQGAPKIVYGEFDVAFNYSLKTLLGAPKEVRGRCDFEHCILQNLDGAPRIINGSLTLQSNNLKSLKGITPIIKGNLSLGNLNFDYGKHTSSSADLNKGYYYGNCKHLKKYDKRNNDKNEISYFDYFPREISGQIEFNHIPTLTAYKGMNIQEIRHMIKDMKKAQREKKILEKDIRISIAMPDRSYKI